MGKYIYIFLLLLCGKTYCGLFTDTKPKDIQDFNDLADKRKVLYEEEYYKLESLKAQSKELTTEIENKISLKDILKNDAELAKNEIAVLKSEKDELQKEKNKLEDEVANDKQSYLKIKESAEKATAEKKELDDKIISLTEEHKDLVQSNRLLDAEKIGKEAENKQLVDQIKTNIEHKENIQKEIGTKENKKKELSEEIKTKDSLREKIQNDITDAETNIRVLEAKDIELKKEINKARNDIADLNKKKAEVVNRVCKEHYTLWNFEFLTNNKKSVFISLLTTVLITALLPFVLNSFISSSPSTEIISPKRKLVNENSQLRLEQLSDDEDSSGMVATSSGLLNRDLKYNYDRDTMERNEDPNRCFDHLRRKYGIRENLKLHWQNLNPEECVKLNLWKVENGELTFTKLMVKKVIKTEKPVLTYELFQTRVNDGSLHVDCKETELAGDDSRIEAKLAMRIFNSLPEFSV